MPRGQKKEIEMEENGTKRRKLREERKNLNPTEVANVNTNHQAETDTIRSKEVANKKLRGRVKSKVVKIDNTEDNQHKVDFEEDGQFIQMEVNDNEFPSEGETSQTQDEQDSDEFETENEQEETEDDTNTQSEHGKQKK